LAGRDRQWAIINFFYFLRPLLPFQIYGTALWSVQSSPFLRQTADVCSTISPHRVLGRPGLLFLCSCRSRISLQLCSCPVVCLGFILSCSCSYFVVSLASPWSYPWSDFVVSLRNPCSYPWSVFAVSFENPFSYPWTPLVVSFENPWSYPWTLM